MIHVIKERVTPQQTNEMLEMLQTYIKLAVDVRRKVVAGGGALHADCEAALLDDDSQQADIWGADWFPESRKVRFESLINIRPQQGNRSLSISEPSLRASIEAVVRQRFEG